MGMLEHTCQDISLREQLDYVQAKSPYYRARVAPGAALMDFPLMSRRELLANYASLLCEREACGGRLLHVLEGKETPPGAHNAGEFILPGGFIVEQTSGTSGIPARLVKTREERRLLALILWKQRKKLDPVVTPVNFIPLFHLGPGTKLPLDPFNPTDEGVKTFYEWLGTKGARWLHMPPVLLDRHIQSLSRIRLKNAVPTLKFIETSGALLPSEVRQRAQEELNVSVCDQYGTRETWAMGYSSGDTGFEILGDAAVIELLDSNGTVIRTPNVIGAVVVTSKIMRLLPIIRYMTGDWGHWTAEGGLKLSRDRSVTMLPLSGKWISGTELFKTALMKVYARFGYLKLDHLQIIKTGPKTFLVEVAGEGVEDVHRGLSEASLAIEHGWIFTIRRLDDVAAVKTDPNYKPYIFINRYDKMEGR